MGNGFQFLDILLFGLVAAFLVLRLRNVLGKKTGHQRERENPVVHRRADEAVAEIPSRGAAVADADFQDVTAGAEAAVPGLSDIAAADRSFDPDVFLEGAESAFEMIVGAFAAGDVGTLESLLSAQVFENFREAVEQRAEDGETLETTIVSVKSATVLEAGMKGSDAVVTVSFVSEQVNVTRDSENRVVAGDPNHVAEITDIWTFRRNVRSADPNWKLVETRSQS